MANFVDLTEPEVVRLTFRQVIDLCSDSSIDSSDVEELQLLSNRLVPVDFGKAISHDVDNCDTSSTDPDDDSSLGIGRGFGDAYGEFWPLHELKISIAPHGYLDFNGIESKSLSADSWYLEKFERFNVFSPVTTRNQRICDIPTSVAFER